MGIVKNTVGKGVGKIATQVLAKVELPKGPLSATACKLRNTPGKVTASDALPHTPSPSKTSPKVQIKALASCQAQTIPNGLFCLAPVRWE